MLQDTKKLYRTTIFVTGKQKVVTGHKKVVQDRENYLKGVKKLYSAGK